MTEEEPQKIKIIPVGSTFIVIFKHNVGKWIGGKVPTDMAYLRNIVTLLLARKKYRENAIFNIGKENFYKAVKQHGRYRTAYAYAEYYEKKIIQFKSDGTARTDELRQYYEEHQQEILGSLPLIDEALLTLFSALTEGTTLDNQQIPKELINISKGVQSINLESRRFQGDYNGV